MKIITSQSEAQGRGIFGQFQRAIAAARAVGTARAVMVCQLPWGPLNEQVPFESPAAFRAKFAPAGMDRTSGGYLMATKFPWPDLHIVRVSGASPVKATINMQKAGPADCVAVTAKWFGSGGNGIVCTVAAASNGVANSFDLTISKTNVATGKSTVEKYTNVDSTQAAGAYWTELTRASVLVGPLVKNDTGRPANGAYTLASGSDGSAIAAADYVGTQGSADKGIAVLEKDSEISFVFCDDVGSGLLATVNSGIAAHVAYMNDRRIGLLTGNPTETEATAKTNAAAHQSESLAYLFPHGKVVDEDAVSDSSPLLTVPLTGPFACLASILQPHVSPAYKLRDFTKVLAPIKELDAGSGAPQNLDLLEKGGVLPFERNTDGVFSPYSSTMTDQRTPIWATRMRRFIMFSLGNALESYRNAPNEDSIQEDERSVVAGFLDQLVENRKIDPVFRPSVNAAALLPEEATNTQADINAGDYSIGFEVQLISEQKRIFLSGNVSESVQVTVAT